METSLSSILAPADLLIQILYLPRLVYFCSFFAYDGLKNGITLTHFGMRTGTIARIYGVFYLVMAMIFLILIPLNLKLIMATNRTDMERALSFAVPIPELGLIFIGLALLMFLIVEASFRFGKRGKLSLRERIRRVRSARKLTNWMCAFPLSIGIQTLIGLPEWVFVCIFAFFIYFAPFSNPKELKKLIPLPAIETPSSVT